MKPRNIITLRSALPEGDGLPTEFRVFAFGVTETSKGPILFDAASAHLVMADYAMRGPDLGLDYEHQALESPPIEAPAAGWFNLEVRGDGTKPEDGLYAINVRWTERAAAYLKGREYRFLSPALTHDEQGRVTSLLNVALTNLPATYFQNPLIAASLVAREDTTMKTILKALGLADTATEADALTALSKREAPLAEVLTLTGKPTHAEALGVINGWKAASEQVVALSQEVASLKGDAEKRERDALILSLKADKKLTPAMEGWASKQSIEALKAFGEVAPTVAALSAAPAREPQAASTKKFSEMSAVEKHNLYVTNPDLYAALKAAK